MWFFSGEVFGNYSYLSFSLQMIIAIAMGFHILIKKQDPNICLGWLLATALSPVLAGIFYVGIGMNPFEKFAERKRRSRQELGLIKQTLVSESIHKKEDDSYLSTGLTGFHRSGDWVSQYRKQPAATDSEIKLLVNSNEVYSRFEEAIKSARNFIVVQFYQILADQVGFRFLSLLEEKAKQGLKVYVLYDALGSISLKEAMAEKYRSSGIEMNRFLEIHPIKRRFQVNWRNHRKLIVVDGQMAFVGGFNIGKTYLQGDDLERPKWVDILFEIRGSAIQDLLNLFIEDWHFTTGRSLVNSLKKGELNINLHAKTSLSHGRDKDINLLSVIPSGPSDNTAPFYSTLLNVIYESKSRVWIMTPYFVPDRALLHAMRLAVGRGVHVRVIAPLESNHPFTDLCSSSYFSELNAYGIELLRYRFGVCHGKVVLADDDLILSGSSNMDYRSFFLNFETDLYIRSAELGRQIESFLMSIVKNSQALALSDISPKPIFRLLIRRLMRLLSPLM